MSERSQDPRSRSRLQQRLSAIIRLEPEDFTCELIGGPVGRPELSEVVPVPPEWLVLDEHLEGGEVAPEAEADELVELGLPGDDVPPAVDAAERELLESVLAEAGRDDQDVVLHSLRVGMLAESIARELGAGDEAATLLRRAAVLHDIGKAVVPEGILFKEGRLDDAEYETSKLHTLAGAKLMDGSRLPVLRLARILAMHHHERWNGTGYPDRLVGRQTPPLARVVAVADVFDALTHERPYKPAWSLEDAAAELARESGRLHEPRVVDALLRVLERAGVRVPARRDVAA